MRHAWLSLAARDWLLCFWRHVYKQTRDFDHVVDNVSNAE